MSAAGKLGRDACGKCGRLEGERHASHCEYGGTVVTKCCHFKHRQECPECKDMSPGQQVIEERAKIRGDFREQAHVSQDLKFRMRSTPNWGPKLSYEQREALDHMQEKIARILTGDPNEPDAWLDLIGYPQLIHNILTKGKPV